MVKAVRRTQTLIPTDFSTGDSDSFETSMIPLDRVKPEIRQSRNVFKEEKIISLAESIREHGLLQPIIVRKDPDSSYYLIVAGERRWRAFNYLNKDGSKPMIPAKLQTEGNYKAIQIIENMQRENLNPIEEAQALCQFLETSNLSQAKAAKALSISTTQFSSKVKLMRVHQQILASEDAKETPSRILIAIAEISDEKQQLEAWDKYSRGEITSRDEIKTSEKDSKAIKPKRAVNVNQLTSKLAEALNSGVLLDDDTTKKLLELADLIQTKID